MPGNAQLPPQASQAAHNAHAAIAERESPAQKENPGRSSEFAFKGVPDEVRERLQDNQGLLNGLGAGLAGALRGDDVETPEPPPPAAEIEEAETETVVVEEQTPDEVRDEILMTFAVEEPSEPAAVVNEDEVEEVPTEDITVSSPPAATN